MTLGIAILGTGRIGGRYIDVVRNTPGATLRLIAEPREEQTAPLKRDNPEVEFVADYRDALAWDDVDAVIATLPHGLHHRATIDAANAGKQIFLEKPMAGSLAECGEMIAAARGNGVMLVVARTQRYMPVVKAMKETVESGELGELVMVYDMWHKRPVFPTSGRRGCSIAPRAEAWA